MNLPSINRVHAEFQRQWEATDDSARLDQLEGTWEDYKAGKLTADETIKELQQCDTK